jgi:hypothetical protein
MIDQIWCWKLSNKTRRIYNGNVLWW